MLRIATGRSSLIGVLAVFPGAEYPSFGAASSVPCRVPNWYVSQKDLGEYAKPKGIPQAYRFPLESMAKNDLSREVQLSRSNRRGCTYIPAADKFTIRTPGVPIRSGRGHGASPMVLFGNFTVPNRPLDDSLKCERIIKHACAG